MPEVYDEDESAADEGHVATGPFNCDRTGTPNFVLKLVAPCCSVVNWENSWKTRSAKLQSWYESSFWGGLFVSAACYGYAMYLQKTYALPVPPEHLFIDAIKRRIAVPPFKTAEWRLYTETEYEIGRLMELSFLALITSGLMFLCGRMHATFLWTPPKILVHDCFRAVENYQASSEDLGAGLLEAQDSAEDEELRLREEN